MLKIAAAGATALCAGILCTTPYSLSVTPQGSVSLSLDSAVARIGHPLTPMSVAGVHRRAMRRTYGVGSTPLELRSKRDTPSVCSMSEMDLETAGSDIAS